MRTPILAILWEIWRTSRFELLGRLVGSCLLVAVFPMIRNREIVSGPEMDVLHGCVVIFLAQTGVLSSTWWRQLDRQESGLQLAFVRPVSTTWLVAIPFAFVLVTTFLSFALPALLFTTLQSVPFPVVTPATIVALGAVLLTAASWSPATKWGKALASFGVAILSIAALVVAHASRNHSEPFLLSIGRPEYYELGLLHFAAILLLIVLALWVTIAAVERQRHGDRFWPAIRLPRRIARAIPWQAVSSAEAAEPFSNRYFAQCWYELRRIGPRVLTLSLFLALLCLGFVTLVPWVDPGWDGAAIVWIIGLFLAPFVYQLVGADGAIGLRTRQGAVWLSPFDATLPMPNDHLIAVKLAVIAVCAFGGWLVTAAVAGLHVALTGTGQLWSRLAAELFDSISSTHGYWWIAGIPAAALLYLSSTAMFLAFGLWLPSHRRTFATVALAVYLQMVLAFVSAKYQWPLSQWWGVYAFVVAAAIVVGCLYALATALRARSLGKWMFGASFCLWVVYVGSMLALLATIEGTASLSPAVIALGAASLLVPLAAVAIAPLALAAHRHA